MAVTISLVSGSARRGTYNGMLVSLAADHLRTLGAEVTTIDLAALALPLYSQDLEQNNCPPAAEILKRQFAASDGLLFATPEHNGSISALLKNAIDWASRPTGEEVPLALSAFRGGTAAIMAASTGPFGGLRALAHLRQILATLQMMVIPEQVAVPHANHAFDADCRLTDTMVISLLHATLARLVDAATRLRK